MRGDGSRHRAPFRRISARRNATASPTVVDDDSAFGIFPRPAYARRVKSILFCLAVVICSFLTGCTSGKSKSRYRNYEGDNNPGIRMMEEGPGSPLNTR
jgi:hypothetical protein